MRWTEEMEEAIELLYRLVADYEGRLSESEALDQIGDWIGDAAR